MRQGRKGKGWLPNPETGLAGSVGQNREKPRRKVAEQDGKKEPDLPQTDLLWAPATAVAKRAVSPPELRRCKDRCARRDGLGKGACKLKAPWEDGAPRGAWRACPSAGARGDISDVGELMAFHC